MYVDLNFLTDKTIVCPAIIFRAPKIWHKTENRKLSVIASEAGEFPVIFVTKYGGGIGSKVKKEMNVFRNF